MEDLFSMRNTFVGLETNLGKILLRDTRHADETISGESRLL